jgi:WhiB family redox-sensing transcriptional regulator
MLVPVDLADAAFGSHLDLAVVVFCEVLDDRTRQELDRRLAEAIFDMHVMRPSWTRRAACRGWSTDLWFPTRGANRGDGDNNGFLAKRICARCPVRSECLAESFEHVDAAGIWGGLSVRERRRARRNIA